MRSSSSPGPEAGERWALASHGLGLGALAWALAACPADPIESDGQLGRPIALASGDLLPLPRLAFIDEACPGTVGGCEDVGDGACELLVIDSLAPLSAIRDPSASGSRLVPDGCLEVRPAGGLASEDPEPAALEAAVSRFRFRNLPLVRAPDQPDWSWTAGNQRQSIEPGGVLGGNLLRNFAVAIRVPLRPPAGAVDGQGPISTVALYSEFPGSEGILANQGRAFLPLQFPGRLLGRELTDRCELDEGRCELDGFDISTSAAEIPLVASRMVMDACVAIPPCGLSYASATDDPFGIGSCGMRRGPTSEQGCVAATDPELGGVSASLVVATGVPGLVLFADSAVRMFGPMADLEPCPEPLSPSTEVIDTMRACRIADDGVLHVAGWPSAGLDVPLTRLRVRSLALVPGAARSRAEGPCQRAQDRRDALFNQCDRYRRDARSSDGRVDIRNAAPPYSAQRDDEDDRVEDPSASSLAVLGESMLQELAAAPRPLRWIPATVVPADHPLVVAVRRDVTPEALEPDGLLGAGVLRGTETVLDYTDINPSLRVTCLEPHDGRCQVLPDCRDDRSAACCHGLPRTMLDELIRTLDDDTCCGALSAEDLAELDEAGHCEEVSPP